MTEPAHLEPIEPHVRQEQPPDDGMLIVRAGPLTAAKFLEHAVRQQRDYSYRGRPMTSISVAATVAGWTVDRILQERLWSRSTYTTATVATIRTASYALLATHAGPHYDILLNSATIESATTLLSLFGAGTTNRFRRRTR
jgi:hypothetical protein